MAEVITYDRANVLQKQVRRFAVSGPGSWLFARVLHRIDRAVYRLMGGRHSLSSLLSGLPLVMLTTTGAKSGQARTVPVLGIPVRGGVAIVASNWGRSRHPAWYYNLCAHPDAEVVVDGILRRVRAIEAGGERRVEIWQEGLRVYPGFEQYDRRASDRRIRLFVLEPL